MQKPSVIQTTDARMKEVLKLAETVAASRASVLISGESGTGKELLARFIHARSLRADHRMVAINCAAVPEGLLESELFGHERGAFTGAVQAKAGKFELAHQGTFLLDEISEMPVLLQTKLLRVLQEGELERIGATHPVRVNVRVIATSNRDLREMIKQGQFREDLYYRLNVIPLEIPPLRARPSDIEFLSRFFLDHAAHENGRPRPDLTVLALDKLKAWHWPGNVRELQNVIVRAVLLAHSAHIQAHDIQGFTPVPARSGVLRAGMTVSEAERELILKTLEHTGDNRTQAAQLLGISIRTLRNKLAEYRQNLTDRLATPEVSI